MPALTFSASKSCVAKTKQIIEHKLQTTRYRRQIYLFVEKENNRYRSEPPVIPNGFEEVKGFAQSVLTGIFAQDHVVRRTRRHEDDGGDVIEALDPLAPFVSLTSHVKHTVKVMHVSLT